MDAQLNHTIVWCSDKQRSAAFLCGLLELPEPVAFGPMLVVRLANGVSLDYYTHEGSVSQQHYAFLVSEPDFVRVFDRIRARGMPFWADPGKQQPGKTYRHNGGRGFYFDDPDGHLLELMTRPYGSSPQDFSAEEP